MKPAFSERAVGSAVEPCPYRTAATTVHWIEIELLGEDDRGIPDERFRIRLPDGQEVDSYLDEHGLARLDNIPVAGQCALSFPALDTAAWTPLGASAPSQAAAAATPYVLETGDTLVRLAELHGLSALAVWFHPANEALRAQRRRMDALAPGDTLHLPELRVRTDACATDRRHRYRRAGVPARIRIQFRASGQPRAGVAYRLDVAGRVVDGALDADGVLEAFVPAAARTAQLRLGGADAPPIALQLGTMRPDDTPAGVRDRIGNLGIRVPAGDDLAAPDWQLALYRLQCRLRVPPTCVLDQATIDALRLAHDHLGGAGRDAA